MEEGCNKCLGKMLGIGLERKGKSQKMLHYRAGDVLEIGIRGNKGMWRWPHDSGKTLWFKGSPKNKSL